MESRDWRILTTQRAATWTGSETTKKPCLQQGGTNTPEVVPWPTPPVVKHTQEEEEEEDDKDTNKSWGWQCMPVIPDFRRLSQYGRKFEDNLIYWGFQASNKSQWGASETA